MSSSTAVAALREQLSEVNELLQEVPGDEELLSLKSELETKIMEEEFKTQGLKTSEWQEIASEVPSAAPESAGPSPPPAAAAASSHAAPPEWHLGQRCEAHLPKSGEEGATGKKSWQAVVVETRKPDGVYGVRVLADGAAREVRATETRRLPRASLQRTVQGMKVMARFSQDGVYYPAVVSQVTEHGAMVTFDAYFNVEHVALEHLRLPETPSGLEVDKKVEIPRRLELLPTDSETEREKKLRQQKSLKRKAKEEIKTLVQEQKQSSWLTFQATAKRAKGALTDLGKAGSSSFKP